MLYIAQKDYERIITHCKKELPNEACGLIGGIKKGKNKYIKKVYLLANMDASRVHFSMNPKEQIEAMKDMRKHGWQLLGNFHSHPASFAKPSLEDKRLAYDTKVNYLIISLIDMENPVLKTYLIDEEKKVTEEEIVLIKKEEGAETQI